LSYGLRRRSHVGELIDQVVNEAVALGPHLASNHSVFQCCSHTRKKS
jgi:hypothetical protein